VAINVMIPLKLGLHGGDQLSARSLAYHRRLTARSRRCCLADVALPHFSIVIWFRR
jgi:hypothetical protein